MPQEFQVVECSTCGTFQVDIVKKAPKWKCKMCGATQLLGTVYLNADAKTCRGTVQDLNLRRGRGELAEQGDGQQAFPLENQKKDSKEGIVKPGE